ncbi:ABC transporter permease [Christensenellaceae bacterium]|nr:ABC transporter permease [Christensenellaceae bacterium]BDF62369.1 ABC transporter permease [Christensenellaceae bacterium]
MEKTKVNVWRSIDKNILWLALIIIGLVVWMTIAAPSNFWKGATFQSMAYQFPEFGIMSLGMMLCMIAGGIDLSVVGISNLAGIMAAVVMQAAGGDVNGGIIIAALVVAVAVGAGAGAFNGFMIGNLRIPAMLVTLSAQQIFMGLGIAITKGPAISGLPESFTAIANGLVFNAIPIPLFIFIAVVVILFLVLRFTVYGQQLYLMGANPTASAYSGINNFGVTMKTYMASGIMAAVAGIIVASHYGSAKADYGTSYQLLTLLIVILGGISPSGGKGKLAGVVLSILVLQIISSAFNILRFDSYLKTFVYGLVMIGVMMVQYGAEVYGGRPKKLKVRKTS